MLTATPTRYTLLLLLLVVASVSAAEQWHNTNGYDNHHNYQHHHHHQQHQHNNNNNRILLDDVKSVVLRRGDMTTGRRVEPIAQLTRVGGSAPAGAYLDSIHCQNMGRNQYGKVDWRCEAQMPDSSLSLGDVEMVCEGYDGPGDAYILAGSCGLEYALNRITNYSHSQHEYNGNHHHHHREDNVEDVETVTTTTTVFTERVPWNTESHEENAVILFCPGPVLLLVLSLLVCVCPTPTSDTTTHGTTVVHHHYGSGSSWYRPWSWFYDRGPYYYNNYPSNTGTRTTTETTIVRKRSGGGGGGGGGGADIKSTGFGGTRMH